MTEVNYVKHPTGPPPSAYTAPTIAPPAAPRPPRHRAYTAPTTAPSAYTAPTTAPSAYTAPTTAPCAHTRTYTFGICGFARNRGAPPAYTAAPSPPSAPPRRGEDGTYTFYIGSSILSKIVK